MQASWQLGATINNLYANYPQADNKGFTDGIGKVINKILKDIYDGVSNAFINKDLFNFTKNELDKAIDEGTIELKDNVPNKAYIKELKTNASVFSAFKNHQQTKAIHALLLDDNGDLVTFSKFKKEALKISNTYNIRHLRTEFNTARSRAAFGAKFKEFEETKHLYPMAEWTPSRAKVPDENHKKLWGTRLPLDDPFWNNHMPGDRWECKCGLKRSNGPEVKPKGKLKAAEAGLKGNPAKTGKVFSNDHPHIKGTSKPDKKKVEKFLKDEDK